MHDEPTPYDTVELTTPARFDDYCDEGTFRYAAYHPWRGGTGGHFLEFIEYNQPCQCVWEVEDLAEAKRILADLDPDTDMGFHPLPECD